MSTPRLPPEHPELPPEGPRPEPAGVGGPQPEHPSGQGQQPEHPSGQGQQPEHPSGQGQQPEPAGSHRFDADPAPDYVPVSPLLPEDPPKVGQFWLDARLGATPSGVAFTGHDQDDRGAMIILLSEGAAADAAARDRLAGVINHLHIDVVLARGGHGQDFGRLARKYDAGSEAPVSPDQRSVAPWAALAYDGSPAAAAEAERILDEVQLAALPQQGRVAGPDYSHYWIDRVKPGLTRLWPLPWPGRYDRAGWRTILVSWLLMLLLAALAVLVAILIFRNQPPQAPPPPTGGSGSPPPQSSSPSPQSGSPPPQSGSPPPQSAPPQSPSAESPPPSSGVPSAPSSGAPSPSSGSPSPGSASPSPSPSSGSPSASGSGPPAADTSPGSRL